MACEELSAWLRLSLTPGLGNAGARKLLAAYGLPQAIFEASQASLETVVRPALAKALLSVPQHFEAQWASTAAWLDADGVAGQATRRLLTLGDKDYPTALLEIEDPPLLLYLLGSADLSASPADRSLAMVGSRNPTPQGAINARDFANALVQAGLTVVSGMALGVDGSAHEGALQSSECAAVLPGQARTIAVIGTGIDRVYPKHHRELAHRIAENGLIISEYPLGTPPLSQNFPRRNRIIAGLSRGTLVVEAALQSGSLITARQALEQGKDVFAIPGSIHVAQSRGCHELIKQGAKLVETARDILDEFEWSCGPARSHALNSDGIELDEDDVSQLLSTMGFDPVSLDALQARTGMPTPQLQAELLELELDGQVARLPGGLFQRIMSA